MNLKLDTVLRLFKSLAHDFSGFALLQEAYDEAVVSMSKDFRGRRLLFKFHVADRNK